MHLENAVSALEENPAQFDIIVTARSFVARLSVAVSMKLGSLTYMPSANMSSVLVTILLP